jgi:hypothetical protein
MTRVKKNLTTVEINIGKNKGNTMEIYENGVTQKKKKRVKITFLIYYYIIGHVLYKS